VRGASGRNLADTDVPEHDDRELIVQLEPDRTHLGSLRIAGAYNVSQTVEHRTP